MIAKVTIINKVFTYMDMDTFDLFFKIENYIIVFFFYIMGGHMLR